MQMTVEFTDVYDGVERARVEVIDVPAPNASDDDGLRDWSEDCLWPLTGDGKHERGEAGYFAEIRSCAERPDLVGREFAWGI